jgi:DNA helicase-2/ATP-dependent DNA helicase PcrA
MFCYVPPWPKKSKDKIYYVYLMWRKGLGWRLGITDDLAVRLKLERAADKIVGLRAFKTEREAQYLEVYLSLKYGIPTVCFKGRKGILIIDEWLEKLYKELPTEEGVKKLAEDLDIDLDFHHYCLAAVTRGSKVRVKINLHFCYRKYISKDGKNKILVNPSILHCVILETSDKQTLDKISKIGLRLKKTKKGQTLRYSFADINKAEDFAFRLKELTGGILEYKFTLGKLNIVNLPALMMPASNVLMGHYLPVKQGGNIVYDRIIGVEEESKQDTVYDLGIEKTHNFIANEVVVHNCIYRWRGAAYSNVLNFMQEYTQAENITLIKNYRSTQAILDSAYQLIQYNNPERFEVKAKINKHLIGLTKGGLPPEHLHFDTHSAEADALSKIIEDKVSLGKFRYRDFAILVRSNSDAQSFIQALNMQNIPWQFSGNQGLYAREEVKLCINFLRVIANPSDSLSLYYLVSSEIYKVNLADLALCNHFAKRRNRTLYAVFNALEKIPELAGVGDQAKEKIKQILLEIEKFMQVSRDETTGRLLYGFLADTGYLKYLTRNPTLEKETKIQNIAKFFNQVRDYELVAKEDRVINFIRHLNLLIDSGDDPPTVEADLDQDAVNILTIHKAKGLEFRVVFLVSLVQGKFPLPKRSQQIALPDCLIKEVLPAGDFHTQEERRLFYVGLTRSKEELYLTSADDYGGKRLRKVSQFVLEALGKQAQEAQKKKPAAIENIQRFAPAKELPRTALVKIPADKLISLSYYQIDDYLTCPLKYKYVNILRVPIMEHHTVIYGRAMHKAVSQYLLRKLDGSKFVLDELLDCFEANFDPQGFLDANHQEERFRIGRQALIRFYEDEEKRCSIPKFIEKEFSFVIGENKITGRFDRIDLENEGAVIMDFKTSAIKTQKDADKRVQESKQLALYALAYQHVFGVLPLAVELYFLESGIIGRHELVNEDLEDVKEDILEVSAGIRQQEYPAKPEYKACTYCAYNQICPCAVIR